MKCLIENHIERISVEVCLINLVPEFRSYPTFQICPILVLKINSILAEGIPAKKGKADTEQQSGKRKQQLWMDDYVVREVWGEESGSKRGIRNFLYEKDID